MGDEKSIPPQLKLPRIIAICGEIGAGKDTSATYLAFNYGYKIIGLSDPVYEAVYRLNPAIVIGHHRAVYLQTLVDKDGWDATKRMYPAVRQMLRTQGTENGRNVHGPYCWINIAKSRMAESGHPLWVIRDLRFPDEAEWIKSEGGVIWRIEGRTSPEVASLPTHVSESHKNQFACDRIIQNDGELPTLYRRINEIMKGYL